MLMVNYRLISLALTSVMITVSIASCDIKSRDEIRASHFTGRNLRSGIWIV